MFQDCVNKELVEKFVNNTLKYTDKEDLKIKKRKS